jgi:hypothetical protein
MRLEKSKRKYFRTENAKERNDAENKIMQEIE